MTLEEYFYDIPEGISDMVSRRELCRRWNMSDRSVRQIIHDISARYDPGDGSFIYSSSRSDTCGYCRTDSEQLRYAFLAEVRGRGLKVFARGNQARRSTMRADGVQPNHNRLAEYRTAKGLSQVDVAGVVTADGLTAQHLSRLERGHAFPTAAQLYGLCWLYGCTPREIYGAEYLAGLKQLLEKGAQTACGGVTEGLR